jgi:hypothetical protein
VRTALTWDVVTNYRCNFSAYFSVLDSLTIFTFLFKRAAEAESEGCKEKSLGNLSLKSLLGVPGPDPHVFGPSVSRSVSQKSGS